MTLPFSAKRLADRRKRLFLGAVEEAASVDHDGVGALIARRQLIAFGAELGDDALGIDQRLGAAEADKANFRATRGAALFSGVCFRGAFGMGALIGKRETLVCRRV